MSTDPAQQGAQKSSDESALASGLDLLCLRFIQFLLQFCRTGVLLGAQKGRGGWGG